MALLTLAGSVCPAAAHNGAVAIAVPVEGIKIDGDLSDWPEGMRRYPIGLADYYGGEPPKDAADFQGDFRIGYNAQENTLYVAVEVQDESVVEQAQGTADYYTQDGCEVDVEVVHKGQSSPVVQYVVYGNEAWFKQSDVYGYRSEGRSKDAEMLVQREGNRHRYEWRIDNQWC